MFDLTNAITNSRQLFCRLFCLGALLSSGCQTPEPTAQASYNCQDTSEFSFLCGPVAAEDIVRIPDTDLLVTSGLNVGIAAHLFLVDTGSLTSRALFQDASSRILPDVIWNSHCPAPLDPERFSLSGIDLLPGANNTHLLFAANDGDRHAIEVFRIRGNVTPVVDWIGCLPMPEGTLPNSVIAMSDGSLYASSFYNPDDADNEWQRMARGEATGKLLSWENDHFAEVDIGPLSGANGLAHSSDEKTLYISTWSASALVSWNRQTGERRDLPLEYLPDNIITLEDGNLLVAAQDTTAASIAACNGPQCPQPWLIALINPVTGTSRELARGPGDSLFNYATTAFPVKDSLFIAGRGDNRLLIKDGSSLLSPK